jgi:cysteine synthase A
MASIREGLVSLIGGTPLMALRTASARSGGARILGKCEWMSAGGSVKDRAALALVEGAERRGELKKGGTVVEGTAGNTGIGLAHVCAAKGYRCVIYMPDTQAREKSELLRSLGAEVRQVPAVPFDDPRNYNHQARAFAIATPGAVWTNQFDNTDNRDGHYDTTAPEIWQQTAGAVDAFVCATGTGGTLAGVARRLKEYKPSVRTFAADPPGSVIYNYIKHGKLTREGSSITEGIGQGRITDNLRGAPIDDAVFIPDSLTVQTMFRVLKDEGLYIGASSALNVAAAIEVGKIMGPSATVVTVICDGAHRYQSRLFSKSWLQSKGVLQYVPDDCKHLVSLA